jgi:hypothetical protein
MKNFSELNLSHDEFVERHSSGKLTIRSDPAAIGFLFKDHLWKYAGKQAAIRTLAFALLPAGVIAFFFVDWPYALGLIVFGLVMVKVAQSHASNSFYKELIENPSFYDLICNEPTQFAMIEEY